MPNWKKIALSGSSPEFSSLDVDNSISAGSLTGSIHFNNLTDSPTLLSSSAQIASDITGSFTSTSASIASNIASLVTDSGSFSTRVTAVEGFSSSIESSIYSYTGSFTGDGSALTNLPSALNNQDVDLGTGGLTVTEINVADVIRHDGDTNTNIKFNDDNVLIFAGGKRGLQVQDDIVVINETGADIDFRVESQNISSMLKVDASTDRVGIGVSNPSHELSVSGTVSASAYIGDGSGLTNVTSNITEEVTVSQTFTNATTASVNHLFGTKDILVTVYDDNDDQFIPSRVNTPDNNNVNIYMDPATTGRVVVAKGGHLVSGSIHKHLMTSVTSSTITHNLQEEFPVVQVYESASREMFLPETIKSIDQNNTQVVLEELIDCYVVIKR